jgi:hypothetical protein
MTNNEFELLKRGEVRAWIEDHIDRNPADVALFFKSNDIPARLVSLQLKYLQKSRRKLPSYYQKRCIIPSLAYEQASSEMTAGMKKATGNRCLDLSCGLGVDSLAFSAHFKEVTALEKDPVLAKITEYNLGLLGAKNVRVIPSDAASFLQSWSGPPFDLIYADPSRRSDTGKRVFRIEDCSPSILQLLPDLHRAGKAFLVKLSPLFDVAEAFRIFPFLNRYSVVSVRNECREVWLEWSAPDHREEKEAEIRILTNNETEVQAHRFPWPTASPEKDREPLSALPDSLPFYLLEPDVAFYKARCTAALFRDYFPSLAGGFSNPSGYFISGEVPPPGFPGRIFKVRDYAPFRAKALRKALREKGKPKWNVSCRDFPLRPPQIRERLGIKEGGDEFLVCTTVSGKRLAFFCERMFQRL